MAFYVTRLWVILCNNSHHSLANKLSPSLNARHIRFMPLSSTISTEFSCGSADAIKMANTTLLLAYLIGGVLVFIIIHALGVRYRLRQRWQRLKSQSSRGPTSDIPYYWSKIILRVAGKRTNLRVSECFRYLYGAQVP